MNTVFFDESIGDYLRREDLYAGQIYVYSPTPATTALCQLARDMCEEAFAPHDPAEAQHHVSVERYTKILKILKPATYAARTSVFIHHPRCKELIRQILDEMRCDLERVCFDVPRLRTATSDEYLTSGTFLKRCGTPTRTSRPAAPLPT